MSLYLMYARGVVHMSLYLMYARGVNVVHMSWGISMKGNNFVHVTVFNVCKGC